MRDPKRIDKILGLVREIWEKYPDMRLTQLILNVPSEYHPYFMEDEILEKKLKEIYKVGV